MQQQIALAQILAEIHQSINPRPTDKVAWGAASEFGQQVGRFGDLRLFSTLEADWLCEVLVASFIACSQSQCLVLRLR